MKRYKKKRRNNDFALCSASGVADSHRPARGYKKGSLSLSLFASPSHEDGAKAEVSTVQCKADADAQTYI